jgi:hypothetical protein
MAITDFIISHPIQTLIIVLAIAYVVRANHVTNQHERAVMFRVGKNNRPAGRAFVSCGRSSNGRRGSICA